MKDKCNWQGIGTIVVITMCLVSILSPAMTQSSISMLSNATDGETEEILNSTLVLSPTPSLTPPLEEQNPSPTSAHNQTQTHVPTPSLIPDHTPVLSHTPPPQEKNTSLLNASNQTQTPTPSPTPGQDNTSTPTPAPSPTPGPDSALTPIPSPTPSPTPSHAAPTITLFAPSSPVHDTDGEPRTFNLSIDQPVNVSWLLNGTEVFNQSNVTESIYMNTSSKTGTWNVSAVATRANGTAMQTWIWNVSSQVTPTPTPGPTPSPSPMTNPASTPTPTPAPLKSPSSNVKPSTPFYIYGWVHYEDDAECFNPIVNIINTNTSENWQAETSAESNFFQLLANNISEGDVLEFNVTDGSQFHSTNSTITRANISSGGLFNINLTPGTLAHVDLGVTNLWLDPETPILDGDLVKVSTTITNTGFDDAQEFKVRFMYGLGEGNTSGAVFNETIIPLLGAGSSKSIATTWNASFGYHTLTVFVDYIHDINESNNQNSTTVYVNTSRDFAVSTVSLSYTDSNESCNPNNLYLGDQVTIKTSLKIINLANQGGKVDVGLYLNETLINVTNVVFDAGNGTYHAPFKWQIDTAGNYNLIVCADYNNIISELNETNNNHSVGVTVLRGDNFTVTNIAVNPPEPLIGDVAELTATIANIGFKKGTNAVEFYDDKSIEINRTEDEYLGGETIKDSIILPDALGIRVHFSYFNYGTITIYDKNGTEMEEFDPRTDKWTEWCNGDTIHIESQWAEFTVDRYEALLANKSISLAAGDYTNISAYWNLSLQEMGWAINGTHNITVKVEPHEEGNTMVVVNPSIDFAVTDLMPPIPDKPVLNETVRLTAAVANYGVRNGTATVRAYCDDIVVNETVLPLNFTDPPKLVDMTWIANTATGGAGHHNISVDIDPDNVVVETNETNNTLPPQQIEVNGTDLAVVNLELPCGQFGGERCYRNKNVSIKATIANLGESDASNITVFFRDGPGEGNTGGSVFFDKTIQRLDSGDSKDINVIWIPVEFGKRTITVSIPFDKADNNETNNERFENVSVKPECDFLVENVSVYPEQVKEGESVTINATIANWGLKNGSVHVSLYVNSTDFVGSKDDRYIEIGRTKQPVYVESGKTNNISISWRVDISGGDHLIFAVVDPDNEIPEWPEDLTKIGDSIILNDPKKAGNNVKSCLLHVPHTELHITNLTLDAPEPVIENKINIIANIKNMGNETANSTVGFYMEQEITYDKGLFDKARTGAYCKPALLVEIPDKLPIRVHFDYIELRAYIMGDPPGNTTNIASTDDFIHASVDGVPVRLFVKSPEVANGQPIKVSQIDFNSPCGNCIVRNMNATCICRRWNDVWTEWRTGNRIEVEGYMIEEVNIKLLVDKYQVLLGDKTITIDANSNALYNVMWNASLPLKLQELAKEYPSRQLLSEKTLVGENYTLIANVEEDIAREETYLSGTDLAVDFSLNGTYYDGDTVNITAKIQNLGLKNATEFKVNFFEIYHYDSDDAKRTQIDSITIAGLDAGDTTSRSAYWNANMRKIKRGPEWDFVDDYMIKLEIVPLENSDFEENATNNVKEQKVSVMRSRDFSISDLSFVVNNETRDAPNGTVSLTPGENVTLNATLNITNLANNGSAVNVIFCVDTVDIEHEIGNAHVEFGCGNGTHQADIVWHVWDFGDVKIAGDHDIIVVADPDNETYELNESNNVSTWRIHVNAPELTVTSLFFEPDKEEINESERVNIKVGVANYGDGNATNVTLVVYDCADRHMDNTDLKVDGSGAYPGTVRIKRDNAVAMKLYLNLDIEKGVVCIRDKEGDLILPPYDTNFHGWTPWIFDSNITVDAVRTNDNGSAFARISKVYYLKQSNRIFSTGNYSLTINETEEKIIPISDDWTASTIGERLIVATINPDNKIQEYNELDNIFARYLTVKTADLAVADINLKWLNDTLIDTDDIIRHNDTVRIVANITNIGVKEVSDFDVRILMDEGLELLNETINTTLMPDILTTVTAEWPAAKVGSHVVTVETDYNNKINETNETNNINANEIYVYGAEVKGNATWESLGLHGLHGTILFNPSQPYEEDDVNISAVINNSGVLNATNFSAALLFDYKPDIYPDVEKNDQLQNSFFKWRQKSNTTSYDNAICTYVYIDTHNETLVERMYGRVTWYQVLTVYDNNDTEVASTDKSCWIHVPGDTITIIRQREDELLPYNISFYPIYNANLTRAENLTLNVNSSTTVSMRVQNVTSGNHTVMLLIDPENKVQEDVDNKSDNIVTRVMDVHPTRDFSVRQVIPERTNISDADVINLTATVTNCGYRNGTTKVWFVDYENEARIYKYYFNKSLNLSEYNLSYLPVSPDATISGLYKNMTIIHRPDVDAIKLNFSCLHQSDADVTGKPCGKLRILNVSGVEVRPEDWEKCGGGSLSMDVINSTWIPGDTIYIHTLNADFNLSGYTTRKDVNNTNVTLNTSVTWDESGNITELHSESKNILRFWNASTGTHNISVMIDPEDEIIEMNETNNTYVLPLSVNATKELEIVELNYSVQNPAPGQDHRHPTDGNNVTITAVVRNNGTATANFSVDLWMDTRKDTSSAPVPYNWNITEEVKTRSITLLSHTELSLAPGENATVTATWANISVYGNPTYVTRAIVDPLDKIDELNESNNEENTEIVMIYPDLTVTDFYAPICERRNASICEKERDALVNIENIGILNTSDVNVSLEMLKHESCSSKTGVLDITNDTIAINITMKGASKIRLHFASLDTTGENSYIEIRGIGEDGKLHHVVTYEGEELENVWTPWWERGNTLSIDYTNVNFYIDGYECGNVYPKAEASEMRICFNSLDTTGENSYMDIYGEKDGELYKVETYSGVEQEYVCTPWVKGNRTIIDYANAFFDVKELWWKEENITNIETINARERVNISLLEAWTKYEGLTTLNVTVDPWDEKVEQREDNNIAAILIYADLVLKDVEYVYEGAELTGVNVAILNNDKAVEKRKGIAFPVCEFNVSLVVTLRGNETIVYEYPRRINETEKIYGGEEGKLNVSLKLNLNESKLRENKTYMFSVIADSNMVHTWGEIEELNEGNNQHSMLVGPDITIGEIYPEPIADGSCKSELGAVIKNVGNRSASNVDVRLKLNCTSRRNVTWPEYNETIDLLPPNEEEKCTFKKVKVEPNEIYDLEVIVDTNNTVDEVNELDNFKQETIGPDLIIENITYHSEKGLEREGDKLIIDENQTIKVWVNNTGKVGAEDIHVEIEIKRQEDGTIFQTSLIPIDCFPAGEVKPVNFSLTPQERGWFDLNATVDVYNNTPEWNKANNAEENNNKTWEVIKVGDPGYKAKPGFLVAKDGGNEFYGGIIYVVGDTQRLSSSNPEKSITTNFGNPIPENATVRSAILYVYPDWAYYEDAQKHKMAFLPEDDTHLQVTFKGTDLSQVLTSPDYTPKANNEDDPVDIPDATKYNASYATYSYDVTAYYDDTKGANNWAQAERLQYPDTEYGYGIAGMALLIVYDDQDAPLTRYWVAEDRDLIFAKIDSPKSTGFEYEECTRKVQFDEVKDPHLANVSLKTVLVSYAPNQALYSDAGGIADALYFNPSDINNPSKNRLIIETGKDDGHWHKVGGDIALTNENEGWAYVNVQEGTNYAAIQSRGAMMGFAHAILKVTYPPDLKPSVDSLLRATVGNPYYIPITITNLGKSAARNIAVRISIEGEGDFNEIITEVPGAGQEGGNKETIRIEMIAPLTEGIFTFNVTVVVDPENKVPELITKSHDGEANNNITKKVTVVVQSGSLVPIAGGGGGGGGGVSGWGTGTGTGEGSGEGEGTGVAGGTGEGEERENGGKTITGRLMKGIVPAASQEAGGGGKGEFSLIGLLMRLAILAVAIALVYAGYRYEKKIHKPKI